MTEISNKTVAILVVAALAVGVAGLLLNLGSTHRLGGLTGFVTSDTGNVNLTIASSLNIQPMTL